MNQKIPVPITFNTYKHHFQFLLKQIKSWQKSEWKYVEPDLSKIGENLIDFYTGKLTVENICNECLYYFKQNKIDGNIAFSEWLHPVKYRKIKLSDSSEWVIKYGKDPENYIHIHPAKKSIHTIRVRAATLKTVLVLMVKTNTTHRNPKENLTEVNHIRTTYLHLSPVKSLKQNKGILQLWNTFLNCYQPHCH